MTISVAMSIMKESILYGGNDMKKILFAASEAVPFIKTGGLADVVGSLPKNFNKEEFDVRVILPKYACIKQEWADKLEYVTNFSMDYNWKSRYVGIFKYELDGITYYFIDNEDYFKVDKPYSSELISDRTLYTAMTGRQV